MSEPPQPEDPIWSRWRQRHSQGNGGNGAPPREAAPEPPPPPPPPPRDEEQPRGFEAHAAHGQHECLEWCPICRTAEIVRSSFPPEVRSQLDDVQRDALVAIRTVLDHYIQRLDADERPSSRVEDIPIR